MIPLEGHIFDIPHLDGIIEGEGPREVDQLVVVHPGHDHRVHLHGLEPGCRGCPDCLDGLLAAVAQRDLPEAVRAQGIEREIDGIQAGGAQRQTGAGGYTKGDGSWVI